MMYRASLHGFRKAPEGVSISRQFRSINIAVGHQCRPFRLYDSGRAC